MADKITLRKVMQRVGGTLKPAFFFAVALLCSAQQAPTDAETPIFQSQSRLILLPFRVVHDRHTVTSLRQSDVILLEDGKPRPFTIFDTPTSQTRLPVELVLLFDTTPKIAALWDPANVFRFISQWDDEQSRAALQPTINKAEVQISVYQTFGRQVDRMTRPTADPHALTSALHSLMGPLPARPEPGSRIALTLPPGRMAVSGGGYTDEAYVTSPFIGGDKRGWTMEAAIGLLNEVSAAQDSVTRILVMFSEGIGATTTVPEDIGNRALDLMQDSHLSDCYRLLPAHSINYNSFPRNYFRMQEFEALGKMTGGRAAEYEAIDARTLRTIVDAVVTDALEQFVVGFAPVSGEDGRNHQLEVKLSSKSIGTIEGGKRRAVYR